MLEQSIIEREIFDDEIKRNYQVCIENLDKLINDIKVYQELIKDYFPKQEQDKRNNNDTDENDIGVMSNQHFQSNEIHDELEHKYSYVRDDVIYVNEKDAFTMANDTTNAAIFASEKEINSPLEGKISKVQSKYSHTQNHSHKALLRLEPQRIEQEKCLFLNDLKQCLRKRNGADLETQAVERKDDAKKTNAIRINTKEVKDQKGSLDHVQSLRDSKNHVMMELESLLLAQLNNQS